MRGDDMLNIILAVLMLVLIFSAFALKSFSMKKRQKHVGFIIIPCSAENTNIEHIVRAYFFEEFFESKKFSRRIIIVKTDDSPCCRKADEIAEKYSIVSSVNMENLTDFIRQHGY